MRLMGPGRDLIVATDGLRGRGFPSGPVTESRMQDRPVWVVPGTLNVCAAEIIVEQGTVALLAVRALDSTRGAELTVIEFLVRRTPAFSSGTDAHDRPNPRNSRSHTTPPSRRRWRKGARRLRPLIFDFEFRLSGSSPRRGTSPRWQWGSPSSATRASPASAHWEPPRPTVGAVEVTGELVTDTSAGIHSHDYEPATRVRIRRISVLVHTEPGTPHDRIQNPGVVEGSCRWIDVQAAPHMGYGPARPLQIGVHTKGIPEALIVDLDLDAAALASPRGRHDRPPDRILRRDHSADPRGRVTHSGRRRLYRCRTSAGSARDLLHPAVDPPGNAERRGS